MNTNSTPQYFLDLSYGCLNGTQNCQEVYTNQCSVIGQGYGLPELTNALNTNVWFQLYGLLGSLTNIWFLSVIFRHKELQVHPMRLFMWTAFADALFFSNQFFNVYQCHLGFPTIISWCVYWQPADYYTKVKAIMMMFKSVGFIEYFGLYLSIMLNICLLSDLILMIKYPFQDKDKRVKKYLFYSFGTSLLVSIFLVV